MSDEHGTLSLKYRECIFGEFEFEVLDGELSVNTAYTLDLHKLISYCLKRMEPLVRQRYCLKNSAKELAEYTHIVHMANLRMAKEVLHRSTAGREEFDQHEYLTSFNFDPFWDFIEGLMKQEYQQFKKRQITARKSALKRGIPITKKSYQAGKVML